MELELLLSHSVRNSSEIVGHFDLEVNIPSKWANKGIK